MAGQLFFPILCAMTTTVPYHQIRALYDERTIRVYQAYSDDIANAALERGTFGGPSFNMNRMTWIKPSFLWMMYRSGFGKKDRWQKRILAVDISRAGFQWALEHACLSHPPKDVDECGKQTWRQQLATSPVRIQWDPERDLLSNALPYRSIQVGLSKEAVPAYVNKWIERITDVTDLAHAIHQLVQDGDFDAARALLPEEKEYIPDAYE